jgi:hypothetical protein
VIFESADSEILLIRREIKMLLIKRNEKRESSVVKKSTWVTQSIQNDDIDKV